MALQKWRSRNTQRLILQEQTTLFSERVLQERMLRKWQRRISERRTSLIQAAGTRKYFLMKRGWDKWRTRHQQKQQELFLEERKKEESRVVFKSQYLWVNKLSAIDIPILPSCSLVRQDEEDEKFENARRGVCKGP